MVTNNFFVPDDGRAGGQAPEDSDRGVRRRRKLDLLEGHDGRLHQILRLGNSTSHHQVSVNFCECCGVLFNPDHYVISNFKADVDGPFSGYW